VVVTRGCICCDATRRCTSTALRICFILLMSFPALNPSMRVILEDRLNFSVNTSQKKPSLSTSRSKELKASRKRTAKKHSQENKPKRPKVCEAPSENEEDETEEEDPALFENSDEEEPTVSCPPARRRAAFHAYSAFASTSAHAYKRLNGTYCLSFHNPQILNPDQLPLDLFWSHLFLPSKPTSITVSRSMPIHS